jgi:ribosomal protein S27AE
MTEFVTLTCPSCGGELQVTDDIDRFACAYCGAEHLVRRGGGIVSLNPALDRLTRVEVEIDQTAFALAIMKLTAEIEELQAQISEIDPGSQTATYVIMIVTSLFASLLVFFDDDALGWILVLWGLMALIIASMRLFELNARKKLKVLEKQLAQKLAELARLREL